MSNVSRTPSTATLEGAGKPRSPGERLIVALDLPAREPALALVDGLGEEVLWYKVGMELFYAEGAPLLEELHRRRKRIFLDLKLHDIPNTMAMAVRSLARWRVGMTTVHVSAGAEAISAVAEAAREADPNLSVIGVTRLTSLAAPDPASPWEDVVQLAGLALDAGLHGWVAPAAAAPLLRARFGVAPTLVCPGIRTADQSKGDQLQVGTPEDAVRGGADWIVVGRPITQAEDPSAVVRQIRARLG